MADFLDQFRSKLKQVQSRQLLAILTKEKDRKNITNLQEFKVRLLELTTQLTSSKLVPTLQVYLAQAESIIDSVSFNTMLERIEDDLVAAFEEANNIDEVLEAHETILNDVVIRNLEFAISDLEGQIASFEFINTTRLGFDNAQFNTFRSTQNNRNADAGNFIFIDPKTGLQARQQNAAFVDFIGEKLLLQLAVSDNKKIVNVRQIFDDEAKQSELVVSTVNSDIMNIIDERIGTFWTQSVLLSTPQKDRGVITKLELDLGRVQTVNFIDIQTISLYPIDIFRLSYIDDSNQQQDLLVDPVQIKSSNRLLFSAVSARKFIVAIRNKNFSQVQFQIKPDSPILAVQREGSERVAALQTELQELVVSPASRRALGLDNLTALQTKKFTEYLLGFDSIGFGISQFNDYSIFVDKTIKVTKCGLVGIKTEEIRPLEDEYTTDTQPTSTDIYLRGSTEYYLLKRDFSDQGVLLNSYTIPVIPFNYSVVRHERVLLNKKSDNELTTSDLGFIQHFTDPTGITLYRNGIEVPNKDLFPSSDAGWRVFTDLSVTEPLTGKGMRYCIQVDSPNPSDIYTASYTPTLSDSNLLAEDTLHQTIIDLDGGLNSWVAPNNLIYFKQDYRGKSIAYSLLNIGIVLHRNTPNATLSPVVNEYLLATGAVLPDKLG